MPQFGHSNHQRYHHFKRTSKVSCDGCVPRISRACQLLTRLHRGICMGVGHEHWSTFVNQIDKEVLIGTTGTCWRCHWRIYILEVDFLDQYSHLRRGYSWSDLRSASSPRNLLPPIEASTYRLHGHVSFCRLNHLVAIWHDHWRYNPSLEFGQRSCSVDYRLRWPRCLCRR